MNEHTYPYQQLDLENLPEEIWEDIPFLDGLYRVSNLGRVKRLDIEVPTKKGTMQLKSKILKPYLQARHNKGMNDYTFFLSVSIHNEGQVFKCSIPRLVYYCFVKKFPLDDYLLVVLTKDNDNKNIKASNLRLVNIRLKQTQIIERGRLIRDIETSYDEYINEGKLISKNPYTKQVSQYTLKGKLLKTFPSISVASKVAGVKEAGIISVLKKRQVQCSGYVWGYGKKKSIDVAAIRKANLEQRDILIGRTVSQYNLKGKLIATYNTIAAASRNTSVNESDIHAVLSERQRSAGGFIWRDGAGKKEIDVKGLLTGEAWRAFRRQKEVMEFNAKGKYMRTYPSVSAAAKENNITSSYISTAIKNEWEVKGVLWKFTER